MRALAQRGGAAVVLLLSLSACVSFGPSVPPADIAVTPMFETAGIIVATRQDGLPVSYRQAGERRFQAAHPLVRFDAGHVATSLFGLSPGTTYEVRVGSTVVTLTTRSDTEGANPPPLRVIRVAPEQDLQSIVDRAEPGDEILLSPGSYAAGLVVRRSGTAEHPIAIRGDLPRGETAKPTAQRTGLPCFDGALNPSEPPRYGIKVEGSRYVVLDGLEVTHAATVGIELEASRCVTVQNCRIRDNDRASISDANLLIHGGGEEAGQHLIQDNHIADLEHPEFRYTYGHVEGVVYYGIKFEDKPGWGTIVRRNLVEGHIDGIASSGDEEVSETVTEDLSDVLERFPNREMDIYENRVVDQRDDAIETDGIFVNQRIYRNELGKCMCATSVSPSLPGPFFFVRNLVTDYYEGCVKLNTSDGRGVIRNVYYYHNTFVPGKTKGNSIMNLWDGTPSRNIVFRNNIFTATQTKGINAMSIQPKFTHRPSFDYDLWTISRMERQYVETKFGSVGLDWEVHGIFEDDACLDASYRLLPASPALDRGTLIPGINEDYEGKAPDCGAFESAGGP